MATLREKQAEETRLALLAAAEALFAEHGYEATSIDGIAAQVGATRGALYHHFPSKQKLMYALLDHRLGEIAASVATVASSEQNPWTRVLAAQSAFVDACAEPSTARLLFIEAPAALGWATWRALDERHFLDMVRGGIGELVGDGTLRPVDVNTVADVYVAALTEAVRLIAADPATRDEAEGAATALLEGLRTTPPA